MVKLLRLKRVVKIILLCYFTKLRLISEISKASIFFGLKAELFLEPCDLKTKEHIPKNVFTNTKKYNEIVTIAKIQI